MGTFAPRSENIEERKVLIPEEVTSYKDLEIIMTSHLKVGEQCQEAYHKANRMLGLVKRTIVYPDPVILVRLYKSRVDSLIGKVQSCGLGCYVRHICFNMFNCCYMRMTFYS